MKEAIRLSDHFTYKKLYKFCFSPVIMMVFTSIYGVVDGFFVSNFVGKTPFAAINLVMPFIMIFGGIGFMFGTGGSALVAKTLGERKPELANRYFSMMVIISFIVGIITSTIGILFMEDIALLLGADEAMLPYCISYGRIVIGCNVTFMLQNLFQSFLITAEKPKLGLYVTLVAGFTNMILDGLFVAVFKWGVEGAAIATGLSQFVGGILPLIYFIRPNDSLLQLKKTKLEIKPILKAAANGASEVVSTVTSSIVGMVYNFQLLKYIGDDGVAAYGTLMYVEFIFIAIFVGYAIGTAPIVGYNFGAENHAELKNILKKSTIITLLGGLLLTGISELFSYPLAYLYVGYDENLLNLTVTAFRIFSLVFLTAGFNIFSSSFFTALNNGLISAIISFLRTFGFKMSMVLILPLILNVNGIWWATVVADILAFILSICFVFAKRKKYHYM